MSDRTEPIANQLIVLREDVEDWGILFDPDTADTFGLNPVSLFIWKHLDGKHTVEDIAAELQKACNNMPNDAAQREFNAIESLRTLPDRADEDLGEQIMDGRTVHGFRVNEGGMTNTVWIDPKTRELVLVEMEFDNAPGLSSTMSDFQFNVELEDELFR